MRIPFQTKRILEFNPRRYDGRTRIPEIGGDILFQNHGEASGLEQLSGRGVHSDGRGTE